MEERATVSSLQPPPLVREPTSLLKKFTGAFDNRITAQLSSKQDIDGLNAAIKDLATSMQAMEGNMAANFEQQEERITKHTE